MKKLFLCLLSLAWVTPSAAQVPEAPLSPPQDPKDYVPFRQMSPTQAAENAPTSPKERYTRLVEAEIGKVWHQHVNWRKETPPGWLEMSFYVTQEGKVEALVMDDVRHSNVILNEISLRAVQRAEIPPIPPDVVAALV